jgi:hypothetical protein
MSEQSLFSRRTILLSSWPLLLAPAAGAGASLQQQGSSTPSSPPGGPIGESFPTQDQDLVKEMVTVAHAKLDRVKELVGRHQTLAKAAYDWGFGDWESALGAASHVGNRDIAEFLLANGARPSIFSAAMLGQLDVVKAFVAASPGVQRIKGPHSITLLRHAMAGGAQAKPVLEYLTQLGGADDRPTEKPLTAEEQASLVGWYPFGPAASDRMEISISRDVLQISRPGRTARGLPHLGGFEFYPVGAENVRIRFERSAANVTMAIYDPGVVLKANRVAGA